MRGGSCDERDDDAHRPATDLFEAREQRARRGARVVGLVAAPRGADQWYSRGARRNKRWYMRIKVVQIVSAAAIPVLAATSLPTWVAGGLGALIVVLESVQQLFQFHSNWTHYRSTSEALKHEKFLSLAHAGSYATAANPRGAAGRAHRGPRLAGARRLGLRAAARAAERQK